MSNNKILLVLLSLIILFVSSCDNSTKKDDKIKVAVTPVQITEMQVSESFQATLEPSKKLYITVPFEQSLANQVYIDQSIVQKGQKLYEFSSDDMLTIKPSLISTINSLKERIDKLQEEEKKVEAKNQKSVLTDIDRLKDNVEILETLLNTGAIEAPFTGLILSKNEVVQDFIDQTKPIKGANEKNIQTANVTLHRLAEIYQLNPIIAVFDMSEGQAENLKSLSKNTGTEFWPAILHVDYNNGSLEFKGNIYIEHFKKDTAHKIKSFAYFANTNNTPILTNNALVTVVMENTEAIIVPKASIVDLEGKKIVYKVNEGVLVPVEVKIGKTTNNTTVIIEGLEGNEQIVFEGMNQAVPGALADVFQLPSNIDANEIKDQN